MPAVIARVCTGGYAPPSSQYSGGLHALLAAMLTVEPAKRPSVVQVLNMPFIVGARSGTGAAACAGAGLQVRAGAAPCDAGAGGDARAGGAGKDARRPDSPSLSRAPAGAFLTESAAVGEARPRPQPKPKRKAARAAQCAPALPGGDAGARARLAERDAELRARERQLSEREQELEERERRLRDQVVFV